MQTEKSLELRASSQHVESRITLMTLLPAKSQADKLEGNLIPVAVDQLPGFTELDTNSINVQKDDKGHILLDGKPHTISRAIESALRLLRLSDNPRHILGEVFQRNAQEIAWMQFELRRPAETFAFWREVTKTEALEGKLKLMDRFVILPNRYLDTSKFYTVIDTSPESWEIRLVVLPPSGGLTSNTLRCEFRNFTLNDPSLPRYQLFHVAGPANPRNGHRPTYTYDISINDHVCVTSDGMRPGLQQLQDEKEERFVWNAEMCFNCRDRVEVQHFERLNNDILKNAFEGAVLLYDHLSAFTPTLNRNSNFKLPPVNRQAREIRLLQFNLVDSSDNISCNLVVKDLDSMPRFKALSYTWGNGSALAMHYTSFNLDDDVTEWPLMGNSAKKGKTKFLQSFEGSTERITVNKMTVLITKHLGSALRCLRDRGDSEYFWIDALCIDQSDWEDRNNQVGMMGDIYSLAQQVIAWLGSSSADDNTLGILNELGSDSFDFEEFIAWAELNGTTTSMWGDHGAPDGDPRFQRILKCLQSQAFSGAVDQFVNHEWWHRVWIFQEAILPSSLVLHRGIYSITFETLWTGVDVIRRLSVMDLPLSPPILAPGMKRGLYAMLAAIRQERQRRHNPEWIYTPVPNEFIYYVETLGTRSASDPRDIIYAALGLTESAPRTIVPNYSKSIMEVFTIAAKETIKHSDDLLLLSLCGGVMDTAATWAEYWMGLDTGLRKKSAPLPTWVPYWGTQHRLGMGAQRLRHDWMVVPDFSAGGSKASGAKFSKDGRILFLKGVVVDVVKSVVGGYKYKTKREPVENKGPDGLKFKLDRSTWLETFSNWEKAVVDIQPRNPEYVSGGLKVDALMHAIHAPFLHHCITGASSEEIDTKDALAELYQPEEKPEIITSIKPSALAQTLFDRENVLLSSNLTVTKDYELVVTEKGYIGVSPPGCSEVAGVHVGDLIVVLSGGIVPFILRQVGKHDRFLLINDAYVHGIMYGEAMKDVKDDDRRKFPII